MLLGYDYSIQYNTWKHDAVVNALSRLHKDIQVFALVLHGTSASTQ